MSYFTSFGFGPSGARSGSLVVCEPDFSSPAHRRVLIVDDDVASLETWALLLADAGLRVEVAPDADACLRAAGAGRFDLLIVDYRLGETSGLDVVRRLRARGNMVPFILATAHASVTITVDAMRLGARTVLEKPLVGDDLVAPVLRELQALEAAAFSVDARAGQSAAVRWAQFVLRASDAPDDPRTLADWARAAGVSRSALIEACARLDINPRDARDLARVLRLARRVSEPWHPEAALAVADHRTLRRLLVRSGLADLPQGLRPSPQVFLARQRFVPQTNAGLAMLRHLIG